MVHFAIGPGRWDPTCYGRQSLPHVDVGVSPNNAERYFSSGNERTKIQIDEAGPDGTKYGYHLKSSDRFAFIGNLCYCGTPTTTFRNSTSDRIEQSIL